MYNAHAPEAVDATSSAQLSDFQRPMNPSPVLRVALDMPLRRLFDYLPPRGAENETRDTGAETVVVERGMRVRVPFGRQRLVGVVVEVAESSDVPADRLKPILDILDPRPVLDQAALALL